MPQSLTHLNALRAFEASARLGTFTRAAEELGVTPAAVGQQVRILEGYLGRKLFRRTAGGLKATEAASSALAELHNGFDLLEAGFQRLEGDAAGDRLSISVAPALAWKWLAPRMQGIYERSPHIDLRMDTSLGLADIAGGEFDLAIRYGEEDRSGLMSPILFEEYSLPLCAPGLWQTGDSSTGEENLLDLPLLHVEENETSDTNVMNWRGWGEVLFGRQDEVLNQGPRYPNSAMALQAALDGQGVAINGLALVIDDIAAGRLIAPLGPKSAMKTRYAYRMVHAPTRHPSPVQTTFMRWIKAEASKTNDRIMAFLAEP